MSELANERHFEQKAKLWREAQRNTMKEFNLLNGSRSGALHCSQKYVMEKSENNKSVYIRNEETI